MVKGDKDSQVTLRQVQAKQIQKRKTSQQSAKLTAQPSGRLHLHNWQPFIVRARLAMHKKII
jgi:hypothetical protein